MNAVEFIKKFGWKDAQICLLNCASPQDRWFMRHDELISDQDFDDLKRLVESHELVKSYGGVTALEELFHVDDMGQAKIMTVGNLTWHDAKQAIADVESCL